MFKKEQKDTPKIEDPEGITIRVMPEEFLFKKGKKMSKPQDEEILDTLKIPSPSPEVEKEAPEPSKEPTTTPSDKKNTPEAPKEKPTLIIILVIVAIVLMGGAGYLFIQSLDTGEEEVITEEQEEGPVEVVPPPPPSPVCGDGKCEEGENSVDCLVDCPLPQVEEPEEEAPTVLISSTDTDGDGLTDIEEEVFGVDIRKKDTDNDGYRDGLEVSNLYNPAGFAPQKIEKTDLVKIYTNPTYNFSIFYPSSWLAKSLDLTDKEVMITSATGEFMHISVNENEEELSILDWYLRESPEVSPAEVETARTKSGLLGVESPDGLNVYFSEGNNVYAISYNIGAKKELNYKSIFEMIVKSFGFEEDISN